MKHILDLPFRALLANCPSRLLNALEGAGRRSLRDVVSMTEKEILGLRNVGEMSFYTLKHELKQLGLELGRVRTEPELPKVTEMDLRDHFAGLALIGLLARHEADAPSMAAAAYGFADAMVDMRHSAMVRQEQWLREVVSRVAGPASDAAAVGMQEGES